MSHDAHGMPDMGGEPLPATAGISFGVKLLVVGGVLLSIMQGSFVAAASPFGRVWPAADSAKIQLPPKNF
jgi:hypothetical protein